MRTGHNHRIHFIGIGGSGMSGPPSAAQHGLPVAGSDLKSSEVTDRIVALAGGRVFARHAASNVEGAGGRVLSAVRPRES